MDYTPQNMDAVWTCLDGIDGSVNVDLDSGVALPGVPTIADVRALPVWPACVAIRGMVVVVRTEEGGSRPQQINSNSTMGLCTVLHCRVGPAFGLRDNVHRSGDGLGQN